jgi:alcohol dehydrogenase, propanol-preferring
MKAMCLHRPGTIEGQPLLLEELPRPEAGAGKVLLRVRACAVCHTDLHLVEGEIVSPEYPRVPGHQVVGMVEEVGEGVAEWRPGLRVGVPWLAFACGECDACRRGDENLCPKARFTGLDQDGGYAEWMVADAGFVLPVPDGLKDTEVAPLLCAGIIGYRSLRKADLRPGEVLGLIGFGASAHLALQVARHWQCTVYVFTRSPSHRGLATSLGATWVGGLEDRSPGPLDRAVLFAPMGELVPSTLEKLRPGGTLAINAIHMSPIPEMPYSRLYGERTLRSVANATRRDGHEFLALAGEIGLRPTIRTYPLASANAALEDLKHSRIDGVGVLTT